MPKRKRQSVLQKAQIVLVDATEQPIERPKKDKNGITAAKRSGTPKKRSRCILNDLHCSRC